MKTKLFSVTKDDFVWQFFIGSGAGGQNRNKRATACRCIHPASGAIGVAQDERTQGQNRKIAFQRCVGNQKFKNWLRTHAAAISAGFSTIEKQVDNLMKEENLKVEYFTP